MMSSGHRETRFRLGCQTITWDKERTEKRDHTVRAAAEESIRRNFAFLKQYAENRR